MIPKTTRFLAMMVCFSVALSTITVGVVPDALAQDRRDVEKAKKAFKEGREFYNDEEYEKAAELFLEAHEFSGRSELYYNIGQAYRNAEKLVQAEKYFQLYLAEMPDAPNSEDVVNLIIEIQQQIAASLATIKVSSEPEGSVMIYIDGEKEARCETPCDIQVQAGTHQIVGRNNRGQETSSQVSVEASQKLNLNLVFKQEGRLMLISDAGGRVRIANRVDTALPLTEPISLEPGTYEVNVSSSEATWTGDVEVQADETLQVMVPMQQLEEAGGTSLLQALSYGLWGVGGALVIGGAFMGMQAQDTLDNLEAQRGNGFGIDPAIVEQGRSQQSTANTLYIAGGAAIGVGVGLFVWDALSGADEPEVAPAPVSEAEVQQAEESAEAAESEPEPAEDSAPEEATEEEDITLDLLE